jgi:hypothetical protein
MEKLLKQHWPIKPIKILILVCAFFLPRAGVCQHEDVVDSTIIIFTGDTSSIMKSSRDSFNKILYTQPWYDFNEYLPDGKYLYVDVRYKKKRCNLEDGVLIQGQFLDSLRSGKFEYYTFCNDNSKSKEFRKLTDIYNYNEGLLHGYYRSNSCLGILYEGFYKHGKRHGFFLSYDPVNGELKEVELFQNDELLYRSSRPNITVPISY